VFVYGSLLSNDVVKVLLGRNPQTFDATLKDHHRFKIKDRVYPAIFPKADFSVEGKVLMSLNEKEKLIFDEFEDVEYLCERVQVDAKMPGGIQIVDAFTYRFPKRSEHLLYGTWDYSSFEKNDHAAFLEMTRGFIEGLHKRIPF